MDVGGVEVVTDDPMNEIEWAKPFQRRCKARYREPSVEDYGRCDRPRNHGDWHALERGMEVVLFRTEVIRTLSSFGESVVRKRIDERDHLRKDI